MNRCQKEMSFGILPLSEYNKQPASYKDLDQLIYDDSEDLTKNSSHSRYKIVDEVIGNYISYRDNFYLYINGSIKLIEYVDRVDDEPVIITITKNNWELI